MLTLPIKQQWFDMIRRGEKLEEYRAITPYYNARFLAHAGAPLTMRLRNGYSKRSPTVECVVIPFCGGSGYPAWGGVPGQRYWVLFIRSVRDVNITCEEGCYDI